jgi:hypothetical protein
MQAQYTADPLNPRLKARVGDPVYGLDLSSTVIAPGPQYSMDLLHSLQGSSLEATFTPQVPALKFEAQDIFGRQRIPLEWRQVDLQPDKNPYVHENMGDIGGMLFSKQ